MSTPQEYWDACLIKTWRNDGRLYEAMQMFKSINGKYPHELEGDILRTPWRSMPWTLFVRPFVAAHLEKISKRLWDQPPEKDVLLLKKLQSSSYTTTTANTNQDKELNNQRAQYRRSRLKVGMHALAVSERNSATDWNVVKGPVRNRVRK